MKCHESMTNQRPIPEKTVDNIDSLASAPISNDPNPARHAQAGQLVLLITSSGKRYLIQLQPGRTFHTHLGRIHHDNLIGQPLGVTVYSQTGHPLLMLEPSLGDLMTRIKRNTQIIYPKDAAHLVHRLNLRAGSTVIEAGTGSGGLTIALAWSVAPTGRVYTYETRPENYQVAQGNLERVGLLDYVTMHQASIREGFQESGVDALVLDLRTPWLFLEQVRAALRPGGFFASLVPTTNQVSELVAALEQQGFADISIEELLLRRYKPVPDRLRPEDNMVAHTGYLVAARPIIDPDDPSRWLSQERKRYAARQELQARIAAEEAARAAAEDPDKPHRPRLP